MRGARTPRRGAQRRCSPRATSPSPIYEQSVEQPLPTAERHPGARRSRRSRASMRATSPAGSQQQVIERYGAQRAYDGGLQDQDDARPRIAARCRTGDQHLPRPTPSGPTASLVAIENSTGEVRAMVGGRDYDDEPVQPRDRGRAPAGLRRSRPSTSPPRWRTASRRTRCGPRRRRSSSCRDTARRRKVRRAQRRRRLLGRATR